MKRGGLRRSRISPSRASLGSRAVAGGLAVAFGNLTLAGYGGIDVTGTSISSGDASSHWQISGGKLSPSATGDTANLNLGPYSLVLDNGQEVTVSIVADTYSALPTDAEITGSLGDAGVDGKTVEVRPGTLTNPGSLFSNYSYTSQTTVQGSFKIAYTSTNGPLRVFKCTNLTLKGFEVEGDGTATYLVDVAGSPSAGIVLDGLSVHGAYRDPLGDYSSAGAYVNNSGITMTSSSGYPDDIVVKNCLVYDLHAGININADGAATVTDNEIYHCYTDSIRLSASASTTGILTAGATVSRNVCYNFLGDPADADNPHVDGIQFFNPVDPGDWQNVVVEQNVIFQDPAAARGKALQGIVSFGGTATAQMVGMRVAGNIVLFDSTHGITIDSIDGGEFFGNTICKWTSGASLSTVLIRLGNDATGAGTAHVRNNISETITVSGTKNEANNVELGLNGSNNSYSSVFVDPTSPALFSDVLTAFAMKVAGPADSDPDIGAAGSGYCTFGSVRDNGTGWSIDTSYETPPTPATFNEVTFDGTNDYLDKTTALTGAADGKQISMVCRFHSNSDGINVRLVNSGLSDYIQFKKVSSDRMLFRLYNGSGTLIFQHFPTNTVNNAGGMMTVFFSADLATGSYHAYFDDTAGGGSATTNTNDDMSLTETVWALCSDSDAGRTERFNGDVAFIWVDDTYIDFSVGANRDDFDAGNLGNSGEGPTGSAPLIFYGGDLQTADERDGNTAQGWNDGYNQGTAGDFTMSGSVVDV